jgi:hypothetical protein
MGWEPATVTLHEYDGDKLVRSVTVQEPEWSPDDVALVIASRRDERVKRGPHGYPLEMAMDPENQFAFEPGKPRRDWAMKALQDAQEAYFTSNKDARGDRSLVWDVSLRKPS